MSTEKATVSDYGNEPAQERRITQVSPLVTDSDELEID